MKPRRNHFSLKKINMKQNMSLNILQRVPFQKIIDYLLHNNVLILQLNFHLSDIKNCHSSTAHTTHGQVITLGKPLSSPTQMITRWKCALWSDGSVVWIYFSKKWKKWMPYAPEQRRKGSFGLLSARRAKARLCDGMVLW